jgi:hypothetical protein
MLNSLSDDLWLPILSYIGNLNQILNLRLVNRHSDKMVKDYFKMTPQEISFRMIVPLVLRDKFSKKACQHLYHHFLIQNVKKLTVVLKDPPQKYSKSDYDLLIYPATIRRLRKFLKNAPQDSFKDLEVKYQASLMHHKFIYWLDKTIRQHYSTAEEYVEYM